MNIRKTCLAIALASAFVVPLAVNAAIVNIEVDSAPPAPVYEQMPARPGYIVTPGYYKYDTEHKKYTWAKGDYQPERHGEHYVASEWHAQDGRYRFNEGHWEHDK
jgi:hypothetical protein